MHFLLVKVSDKIVPWRIIKFKWFFCRWIVSSDDTSRQIFIYAGTRIKLYIWFQFYTLKYAKYHHFKDPASNISSSSCPMPMLVNVPSTIISIVNMTIMTPPWSPATQAPCPPSSSWRCPPRSRKLGQEVAPQVLRSDGEGLAWCEDYHDDYLLFWVILILQTKWSDWGQWWW